MFSRVLCACCALCFLAATETVSYDFTTADRLPDWLTSNGVFVPGQGLVTRGTSDQDGLLIRIDVDLPIHLHSLTVSGNGEALSIILLPSMCTHDGVTRRILASMPDGQPWHLFTQDVNCYSTFDYLLIGLDAVVDPENWTT